MKTDQKQILVAGVGILSAIGIAVILTNKIKRNANRASFTLMGITAPMDLMDKVCSCENRTDAKKLFGDDTCDSYFELFPDKKMC